MEQNKRNPRNMLANMQCPGVTHAHKAIGIPAVQKQCKECEIVLPQAGERPVRERGEVSSGL